MFKLSYSLQNEEETEKKKEKEFETKSFEKQSDHRGV